MQSYRVLETCSPYLVGSIYVALELLLLYIVCENLGRFSSEDLYSWVIEVKGEISGIAMAGPINHESACFFVAKSDTGIFGLSEYLRWKVYGELRDFSRVNDAGDLGIKGLRQYKQKFRPLQLDRVYTASL